MDFQFLVLISLAITGFLWWLIIYVVIDQFATEEKNLLSTKKASFLTGITVLSIFFVVFLITFNVTSSSISNGFIGRDDTGIEVLYYFSGIIGSIATAVAVWVAILIPKKIAEQQNLIALFDKRVNIHAIIFELCDIANNIKSYTFSSSVIDTLKNHYKKIIFSTSNYVFLTNLLDYIDENYCSKKSEVYFTFDYDIYISFEQLVMSFRNLVNDLLSDIKKGENQNKAKKIESIDKFKTFASDGNLKNIKNFVIIREE